MLELYLDETELAVLAGDHVFSTPASQKYEFASLRHHGRVIADAIRVSLLGGGAFARQNRA